MQQLNRSRVASIDLLRGTAMIIMALDHARDYFHAANFLYNPLDLSKTTAPIFLTRWITHFCAPIFMLLAGTAAYLVGQRMTKRNLSAYLFKRGLWLIFLEMVVVNFGWNFNIHFTIILFITIWALGVSMIVLAGMIHLPVKWILLCCGILVAGHNLLDTIHVAGNTLPAFGWALLHEQNFFTWGKYTVLVGYPLIPWIGIMPLGYCLGAWYAPGYDALKRQRNLLRLGVSVLLLFVLLRTFNIYGDPVPWSSQSSTLFSLLSFINVNKYPPSLLYTLLMLGPALIFLALTENAKGRLVNFVSIYGRVPMFYYLVHIYLIHLLAMILSQLFTPVSWDNWILKQALWFNTDLSGYGFSLPVVYAVWIFVVVALFPLCKRYDAYKLANKGKWWLSYL